MRHLIIFLLGHHSNAIIIYSHLQLSTLAFPRVKYIISQLKKKFLPKRIEKSSVKPR